MNQVEHRDVKNESLVLPLWKLAFMMSVTLGLYGIYWFYKNWLAIKYPERSKFRLFIRAFIAPVTAGFLFVKFTDKKTAVFLAIAYLLLNIAGRLPSPWWLISALAFLPLLPIQKIINRLRGDIKPTNSFSWKEGLVAGIGLVILLSAIAAILLGL